MNCVTNSDSEDSGKSKRFVNGDGSEALTNGAVTPRMFTGRSMLRPYRTASCVRRRLTLRQANDAAGLQVNVNFVVSRPSGQPWHGAHGAQERIEKPGADAGADVANWDGEACGRTLQVRVVAQAQVSLRHADGQLIETET